MIRQIIRKGANGFGYFFLHVFNCLLRSTLSDSAPLSS